VVQARGLLPSRGVLGNHPPSTPRSPVFRKPALGASPRSERALHHRRRPSTSQELRHARRRVGLDRGWQRWGARAAGKGSASERCGGYARGARRGRPLRCEDSRRVPAPAGAATPGRLWHRLGRRARRGARARARRRVLSCRATPPPGRILAARRPPPPTPPDRPLAPLGATRDSTDPSGAAAGNTGHWRRPDGEPPAGPSRAMDRVQRGRSAGAPLLHGPGAGRARLRDAWGPLRGPQARHSGAHTGSVGRAGRHRTRSPDETRLKALPAPSSPARAG